MKLAAFAVLTFIALATSGAPHAIAQGKAGAQAPVFEVDPYWPKPLPNHWVTGSTIGVSVDPQDNVWTIHRPNTVEANFKAADLMVGVAPLVEQRGAEDEALRGESGAVGAQGVEGVRLVHEAGNGDAHEKL